jgi:hypothetical protein
MELNILEKIAEINPEALTIDGFDDAIVGIGERINLGPVVIYDEEKMIEIIMNDMDVSVDELEEGETIEDKKYSMSLEHFEFNIKGAWVGKFTPIFMRKIN